MLSESMKAPSAVAVAIYSDFVMRDYTSVLRTITVPTVVFAGDSNVFRRGIEQGRWVAEQIPAASFVASSAGGHLLFYEEPDRFNAELTRFLARAKS